MTNLRNAAIGLVIAFVALGVLRHQWIERGKAEAALEAAMVNLEEAREAVTVAEAERAAFEARSVQATAEIEEARRQAANAQALARSRQREAAERATLETEALRVTLDSAQAQALTRIEDAHLEEVDALTDQVTAVEAQLVAADSLLVIESQRRALLLTSLELQEDELAQAREAIAIATKASGGGARSWVIPALAGAGIMWLATR